MLDKAIARNTKCIPIKYERINLTTSSKENSDQAFKWYIIAQALSYTGVLIMRRRVDFIVCNGVWKPVVFIKYQLLIFDD